MDERRQGVDRGGAEKALESRIGGDIKRPPDAAQATIEADHPIGSGEHEMEIVAHKENAAATPSPQFGDEGCEGRLALDIDPGEGLVEHQEIGVAQERTGQKQPSELAAGKRPHLSLGGIFKADFAQRRDQPDLWKASGEREETPRGHGQKKIKLEPLGRVADDDTGCLAHLSRCRRKNAQQYPHEAGFAGAVGSDEGDNLAPSHYKIDPIEHDGAAQTERHAACLDEGVAV